MENMTTSHLLIHLRQSDLSARDGYHCLNETRRLGLYQQKMRQTCAAGDENHPRWRQQLNSDLEILNIFDVLGVRQT